MVYLLTGIINFVFGLVISGLLLRFILRLLGANPGAGFTAFIYDSTTSLLDPFRNIFTPFVIDRGMVLEFSTLFAIVIYSLISWLIVEFVSYIAYIAPDYSKK